MTATAENTKVPYLDTITNSIGLRDYYQHFHHLASQPTPRLLLDSGLITEEHLNEILNAPDFRSDQHLGFNLYRKKLISDEDLGHLLGACFGLPFVYLHHFDIDLKAVQQIPASFARKYNIIPLIFLENNKLVVAVFDPTNNQLLENLQFITGHVVEFAVATHDDISLAISTYYSEQEMAQALANIEGFVKSSPEQHKDNQINEKILERPVVKLVQNLLTDAVISRASDIHIRPTQHSVDILFRIDGMLVPQRSLNKQLQEVVITRIKILGGMDISERRLPQDGRSKIHFLDKDIDLRLSIIPSVYGEDVVIRLLDTQFAMKHLEDLGYEGDDAHRIKDVLSRNNGMFLITGPTGSGKSTTLYTVLEQIRHESINIITIEDPVEYHIDGIMQIQVHPQISYTFARALKHILRHDPDVIMVGEIRDKETAKMAVESALTGHLMLSTLHTNSAVTTITRFLEIGIEPYMLASTLLGVLAQRLARCNCKHCLVIEEVDPSIRQIMGASANELFYKGSGCDVCKHRGVKGRRAVYELLIISAEMRENIKHDIDANQLQKIAIKEGMTPLTQHALHLARQKIISLAEAYRVRLD